MAIAEIAGALLTAQDYQQLKTHAKTRQPQRAWRTMISRCCFRLHCRWPIAALAVSGCDLDGGAKNDACGCCYCPFSRCGGLHGSDRHERVEIGTGIVTEMETGTGTGTGTGTMESADGGGGHGCGLGPYSFPSPGPSHGSRGHDSGDCAPDCPSRDLAFPLSLTARGVLVAGGHPKDLKGVFSLARPEHYW